MAGLTRCAESGSAAPGRIALASDGTAVEPNRYLRARLGRLSRTTHPGLRPVAATWEAMAGLGLPPHEVSLAANIGGPFSAPRDLLAAMRALTTRAVAWIVPAQRGPRRWCLAGALPPELHGEEERPGVSLVLEALGPAAGPDRQALFPWTFRARFADAEAAEVAVIERFLPKQMDEAETTAAIQAIKGELGASGMKDMGRVMAELKARHGSQLDMSKASGLVKAALAG